MQLALRLHVEPEERPRGQHEQRDVDEEHLGPAHVVAHPHRGEHEDRQRAHQQVVEVRRQVEERFDLDLQRLVRTQDPRQQLHAGLDRALRPAVLLRLEGVHFHRHFRRRDDVREEHEPPADELGAVAEVEILGQRVMLPSARRLDRFTPPHPRGAVEIEEAPGAVPAAVLEHEVRVEQDRLDLGQQRVILVDVTPARLHHPDVRRVEMRQRLQQEVLRRNEVGVEDRDEVGLRQLQARFERARLVSRAIDAMQVADVEAARRMPADGELGNSPWFRRWNRPAPGFRAGAAGSPSRRPRRSGDRRRTSRCKSGVEP